jgi:uncharacterized caspase-like protein
MLRAVVIGIDRYKDKNINRLSYACADAEAVASVLEGRIHPSERAVTVLTNQNATKRNINVAIGEDLARTARSDDIILLYFAGHGSPETEGSPDKVSRYLIPYDTEYSNIFTTGIDMERELPLWFQRMNKPKLITFFIDSCFSGRAGGRTFEGPELLRSRALERGESIRLRELELGEGRLMMAACDDDQVAREDRRLAHGVFTHFLLRTLTQPNSQTNTITFSNIYDEVSKAVSDYTCGRQIPVLNGRNVLARMPRLAP